MESIDSHRNDIAQAPDEPRRDNTELMQKIREIIRSLPEKQRIVIHLRDIEGYDFAEIAVITGMLETTARVNLSRARKKIRDVLTTQNIYEYHGN